MVAFLFNLVRSSVSSIYILSPFVLVTILVAGFHALQTSSAGAAVNTDLCILSVNRQGRADTLAFAALRTINGVVFNLIGKAEFGTD